jgi:ribosomal protein S6
VKTNRPVGPWKLMTATVQPNLQNEILRQNKLFTSVVRFTFIQHR